MYDVKKDYFWNISPHNDVTREPEKWLNSVMCERKFLSIHFLIKNNGSFNEKKLCKFQNLIRHKKFIDTLNLSAETSSSKNLRTFNAVLF